MQGSTFAAICEMTDVFEGSIVRFMRRLDELLNQLIKAATVGTLSADTSLPFETSCRAICLQASNVNCLLQLVTQLS